MLKKSQFLLDKESIILNVSRLLKKAVKASSAASLLGLSGGVDSSLLAFLSPSSKLVTVGVEGSSDYRQAEKLADMKNWSLSKIILSKPQAEEVIKEVINILSKNKVKLDPINIGVGSVVYALCRYARESGIKTLIGGLGAEEIFGGYQVHVDCHKKKNFEEAFQNLCLERLRNIKERDIDRDAAISKHFGVNIQSPFLDRDLVEYAMQISPRLKVDSHERKIILREVAVRLGVPTEFAYRKKVAAQYGSGFDKVLSEMARKRKIKSKNQFIRELK